MADLLSESTELHLFQARWTRPIHVFWPSYPHELKSRQEGLKHISAVASDIIDFLGGNSAQIEARWHLQEYSLKKLWTQISTMDSYKRFFLVILREMLNDDKISLPITVVRKIGVKIPHRVIFKLPDGVKWEIRVIKSEKMIWFHRGWREFAQYYGLDHGSLLILKFDGESAFKVIIFDITASEIDYPCAQKTSKDIRNSIKLERDLRVGNSIKLERDLRGKPSLPEPQPFKKVKSEDPWPGNEEFRDTHIVSDDDEEDGDEPSAEAIIPISKLRKTISATKKTQALDRTSIFKSANPFFRVVMQPSYISRLFYLHVPCKFARKHFPLKQGDCTFSVANGETWRAVYVFEDDPHYIVRVVMGWREFVLDNYLKVGDVCVFELIKTRELLFKVSIFPSDKFQDPSCQAVNVEVSYELRCKSFWVTKTVRLLLQRVGGDCKIDVNDPSSFSGGPKSCQITRKHVTCNPFFEICIGTSSILQASLHIPTKFANNYLESSDIEKVTFKVGDRRWVVKVKRYSNATKFSGGWRTFARDNDLQVRDVCLFELVGDGTYEFQVSISRCS